MENWPEGMIGRLKELLAGRMARAIDRRMMEWMHGPEHPIVRAHRANEAYETATRIDVHPVALDIHRDMGRKLRTLPAPEGGALMLSYHYAVSQCPMAQVQGPSLSESIQHLMGRTPAPGWQYHEIRVNPPIPPIGDSSDVTVFHVLVKSVPVEGEPAHVHTTPGVAGWPPQTSIWHGYQDLTGEGWMKPKYRDPGVPTTACSWCPTVFPAADAYKSTESGYLICPACFARGEQAGRAKLKEGGEAD